MKKGSTRSPTQLSGMTGLLGNSPWAIREGIHRQLVSDFNHYLRAGPAATEQLERLRAARDARAEDLTQTQEAASGIAILALHGTIVPRGSMMIDLCGAASPHSFADSVSQAALDPSIASIILDIDSGGGAVSGIDVASEAVRRAALVKPVTAVVNTTACSAALWIAAQAQDIVITPAGEMGSIGVIGTHVDESAAVEQEGLKVTYVRSTPGKALGQSTEAMEGPVLESWQSEVDRIHTLFIEAVAQGRGRSADNVRKNWATGEVWFGQDAVNQGLADRVGTLGDVISQHMQDAAQQQARQARKGRVASRALRQMQARVDTLASSRTVAPQRAAEAVLACGSLYQDLGAACAESSPEELPEFQELRAETAVLQTHFAGLARAATPQEDPPMLIKLQAADGTVHEVENSEEAVQAFVLAQLGSAAEASKAAVTTAEAETAARITEARNTHLTSIGDLFSLTPEQATASDLSPWEAAARNAAAVTEHRAALLTELEQLAVTVDGNSGAAAQIVKLAGAASLTDLQATVTAYRDRRDAMIPGRRSVDAEIRDEEVKAPARKPNFDRN